MLRNIAKDLKIFLSSNIIVSDGKKKGRECSVNTYITEGVGKRIVDALKKQSEVELTSQMGAPVEDPVETITAVQPPLNDFVPSQEAEQQIPEVPFVAENNYVQTQPVSQSVFTPLNSNPMMQSNIYAQPTPSISDFGGLEVPANVAVLKQLVSQLPSGVSRQAGALVIKQTMEALGISMKSVLQEAQQLQEGINASARDCQNNILECKKQINVLEAQVQKYQKQSASLNEIVSLFLQLN